MSNQHPIIPPPELVEQWYESADNASEDVIEGVSAQAAQWGADQELAACCEVMRVNEDYVSDGVLRAIRRPQPPSLKEQALSELNLTADPDGAELSRTQVELIRKALEALPDD